MAVKRRNKSVYISVYSYTIPAFWLKNPVFPGVFVSSINTSILQWAIKLLKQRAAYKNPPQTGEDGNSTSFLFLEA